MNKPRQLYLDFDRTLIKSTVLLRDIASAIADYPGLNIDEQSVMKLYSNYKSRQKNHPDKLIRDLGDFDLIEELEYAFDIENELMDEIIKYCTKRLTAEKYIFDDAMSLFTLLESLDSSIHIVTRGKQRFQYFKWSLVSDIINADSFDATLGDKADIIINYRRSQESDAIFVDDRIETFNDKFVHKLTEHRVKPVWINRTIAKTPNHNKSILVIDSLDKLL